MSLAQAQNPGSDVHLLEEVIVSGSPIRDSQRAALDAKRNASNAVDMVAADTIGRFPIGSYDTGKPWASNTTNSIGGTYFDNKGLYETWAATGELEIGAIPDANLTVIDEDILAAYAMATTDYS